MEYDKVKSTDDSDSDRDVDEEASVHHKPSPSSCAQGVKQLLWIVFIERIVLAIIVFAVWERVVPEPTNLNYQVLTPDNKSYPSGPVAWTQRFEMLPCGKTPEEALARGCEFDMLATAWLPVGDAADLEGAEFLAIGQWDYYRALHGTEKYNSYEPEVLGSITRPHSIWTSRRWHVVHCLYMFKKLNRALVKGWQVDGEVISEPHTEHCMGAFQEALFGPPLDQEEINIFLEIIYPSC